MKTLVTTLTLLLCLGLAPTGLLAQGPGTAAKIGVISMQAAILNTAEGKKAMADLQRKYQPRQQEIQKDQQDVQALNDQLQKQAATLSDDEQQRLTRELQEKQTHLKRASEDAQADFENDRNDMFSRIGQKMMKVISDYAKQNGFTLIIGRDQVPIYFAATEVELTNQIVKLYDSAYPADAPTTGGAPTHPSSTSTPRSTKPKP